MRYALLLLIALTVACGGSSPASPTVPTPTPPAVVTPAPTVPVVPAADLVVDGVLRSDPIPPDFAAWSFSGFLANHGTGCASAISGNALLVNSSGQVIATRAWTAPDLTLLKPQDRAAFSGCCFSTDELNHTTVFRVVFAFTTVAC